MKKYITIALLSAYSLTVTAQKKMRSIDELINRTDPGWNRVKQWIDSAKNPVEILPADTLKSKEELYKIQVTTRSPMGAIIFMTGGLLVDHGWIRILGSGSLKLTRSLPEWNKEKTINGSGEAPPCLLIADDVLGGFFLVNGGALGKDIGKVYYFSPDNLEYEPMDFTYTEFLLFCFNNDLDKYYQGYRWTNWKEEVAKLSGDQVFHFLPPLWSKEGKDFKKDTKAPVPIEEQYQFNRQMRQQLGLDAGEHK